MVLKRTNAPIIEILRFVQACNGFQWFLEVSEIKKNRISVYILSTHWKQISELFEKLTHLLFVWIIHVVCDERLEVFL
jgi:hypothetical protein